MAVFAQVEALAGILKTIAEQVRFARARFGQYDLIDFGAVLIGYVLSGEPTLLAFYDRLTPFASEFILLGVSVAGTSRSQQANKRYFSSKVVETQDVLIKYERCRPS